MSPRNHHARFISQTAEGNSRLNQYNMNSVSANPSPRQSVAGPKQLLIGGDANQPKRAIHHHKQHLEALGSWMDTTTKPLMQKEIDGGKPVGGSAFGSRNRSVAVSTTMSHKTDDKAMLIAPGTGLQKTARSILGKRVLDDSMSRAPSTAQSQLPNQHTKKRGHSSKFTFSLSLFLTFSDDKFVSLILPIFSQFDYSHAEYDLARVCYQPVAEELGGLWH